MRKMQAAAPLAIILALATLTASEGLERSGGSADVLVPEGEAELLGVSQEDKDCPQRQQETAQSLEALEAARLLTRENALYGVPDNSTQALITTWQGQYATAVSEYNFYCTQTKADLAAIKAALRQKEDTAAAEAAAAGLKAAQARIEADREAAAKKAAEKAARQHKEQREKDDARRESALKTKALADEAVAAQTARLKAMVQISQNVYATVQDEVGAPLEGATVTSKCLFTQHTGTTGKTGEVTLSNGLAGPSGRQCIMSAAMAGRTTVRFPMTVLNGETDARDMQAVLLPEATDAKQFRFVVQWGSNPANLDAHLLVPMPQGGYQDIAEAPMFGANKDIQWGKSGHQAALPYATLDHATDRGFGPEVVSLHNVNDGTYHFVVKDASDEYTTPREFKASHARAFLYQGNQLLNSVAINTAEGGATFMWNVYSLTCKTGTCSLAVNNKFIAKVPVA